MFSNTLIKAPSSPFKVCSNWNLFLDIKFFTVTFYKADGKLRKLNGRLGVTKHIKHFKDRVANKRPSKYLIVYDVHAEGYRNVDVTNICSIKVDGIEHVIPPTPEIF